MFETGADKIDQLDAMRRGVDYTWTMTCRGLTVAVRPLCMKETIEIAVKVNDALMALPDSARTRLMESSMLAKETLKMATKPDVDSTMEPKLTDYIMDRMTPDELQHLHRQYVQACDRVNPVLERISKERLAELVDEVKKKESTLTELSFLELVNVCRYLSRGD